MVRDVKPIKQSTDELTLTEVCDIVGITPSGYRYLRTTGRAPRGVKRGGRLFFRRRDIDEWMSLRTQPV